MLDAVSLAVHQAPAQISMLVRNIVLKLRQPMLFCGPSLLQLHIQLRLDQFTGVAAEGSHMLPNPCATLAGSSDWTLAVLDWLPA